MVGDDLRRARFLQAEFRVLMEVAPPGHHLPEPGFDAPLGGDRYQAKLVATVAAISGSYEGTVAMLDKVAPESYRLVFDGAGKHGFVNGESRITLREEGATTIVDVSGTMEVGGMIARMGQRLIGSVSKMMLDRFFACMAGKV